MSLLEMMSYLWYKADDTIVFGHKVVLMSPSQYFRAVFTSFSENKKDIVDIREPDSTVLNNKLVDYIYSGKIMIKKENVQVIINIWFVLDIHQHHLNALLLISQGFVIGWKCLTVRLCKRRMCEVFTETTKSNQLSWY